jgi:hypothetical protein
MMRNPLRSRYLLLGAALLMTAFFATGCGTTFLEKSGKMPNENTSKHVKGYQSGNSQAIRPVMPRFFLR